MFYLFAAERISIDQNVWVLVNYNKLKAVVQNITEMNNTLAKKK